MDPKVSFIVPCYKLAHFLGGCVNSILAQTYDNFELLIMDDCSPDNTAEVAEGIRDKRVIYVRNETNLGIVKNFNKGIELSRGRYVWIISADDCLRTQNVLQRYVDLLERNSQVGYVFCPAVVLEEGKELRVLDWSAWPGDRDRILSGSEVVRRSAYCCPVSAPTGLARKECYARVGGYPLILPRTGDWYLWAIFATMYDIGYFSEPMVYYRWHATNNEKIMLQEQPSVYFEQDLLARWLIKKEAEKAGLHCLFPHFYRGLADQYILILVKKEVENWQHGPTWNDVTKEIYDNASNEKEAKEILRLIHTTWPGALTDGHTLAGAAYHKIGQLDQAVTAFRAALVSNPWSMKPRIYLWATRLEQLFGIRLVPWYKSLKKALQRRFSFG